MTDNERVLHTVLSTCNKKFYKCHEASDHVEMLNDRIDEIRQIVADQVLYNAKTETAKRIAMNIVL